MQLSTKQFNKLQKAILDEVKMKPGTKGPLAVIVANDNPMYYQQRAIEAIHTAKDNVMARDQRLLAIRLLILTEMHYAATENLQSQEGS